MKKSFSDYAEKNKFSVNNNSSGDKTSPSGDGAAFDMLKNIAGKYEGASESELIAAIMGEAVKARAAGTLSDTEIDSFVAQISPMLTPIQRSRLNAVVAKIKKQ